MPGGGLRVAIIIGSVRAGRFGRTVADWLAAQACRRCDIEVDILDLAETWLPDATLDQHTPRPAAVADLARWLAAADAFVIVAPEHNHSFPAALKNAIDWYVHEWQAKPVGFVCYGGAAGGLRAVEQLRQVFACLEAMTVPETVSLRSEHEHPSAHSTDAQRMLDQLFWWAEALRNHRAERHPPKGSR
jgi:NAD(P)H-dependent FMN reductase